MTTTFDKALAGFFSLAGVVVAAIALLGVTRCVEYNRWKERTCLSQGGTLVYNSTGRDACMKVEMSPLPVPAKP